MSGQTSSSSSHSARPEKISQSSLASSGASGAQIDSGERMESVLQAGVGQVDAHAQFRQRATTAHAAVGQQHEAIAHAFGIGQLMNGEDQRAPLAGYATEQLGDGARLPQVKAVERLVHQ